MSKSIAEEFHKRIGDTLNVAGSDLKIVGIYNCGSLLLDVALIVDIDEVRKITRFGNDSVCAYYIEQTGDVPDRELTPRIQQVFKGREVSLAALDQPRTAGDGNMLFDLFVRLLSRVTLPTAALGNASLGSGDGHTAGKPGGATTIRTTASIKGRPPLLPVEVRSPTDWASRFQDFSGPRFVSGHHERDRRDDCRLEHREHDADERHRTDHRVRHPQGQRLVPLRRVAIDHLGERGAGILRRDWLHRRLVADAGHQLHLARPHLPRGHARPALVALAFSTVLGIFGGLYPAVWAMRMMPMDAIRRG